MVDLSSPVDTTLPMPTRRMPLTDRLRFPTDQWWPWLEALLKTTRSAVGAVQETVDNLAGVWTLSVNSNNRVTGQIKLDGSAALSSFSVLADKFIIVHPSVNGTTIQAFIVGLVNGVSTVGISGNLVVDGTILARHLDVGTLSAISADVGTLSAGLIQSTDGSSFWDLDTGELQITSA